MTTGDVLDSCTASELRLDSLYLQCTDGYKADVSGVLPKQETQTSEHQSAASGAEGLHTVKGFLGPYTTPKVLPSANAPQTDATESEVGLADAYLSPTADSCENISLTTTDKGRLL